MIADGLTLSTSPTSPRSTSSPSTTVPRRRAPSSAASSPDSPTAIGPCWLSRPTSLAPDLTGEHHPDDVHDLGRRDSQAALELALEPDPLEHGLDLRTAAVHDDGAQAGIPEEGDVLGEGGLEVVVDHGVAAVLDDDEGAAEALEPRQCLDEGRGLAGGDTEGRGVDEAPQVGGLVGTRARAAHVL